MKKGMKLLLAAAVGVLVAVWAIVYMDPGVGRMHWDDDDDDEEEEDDDFVPEDRADTDRPYTDLNLDGTKENQPTSTEQVKDETQTSSGESDQSNQNE